MVRKSYPLEFKLPTAHPRDRQQDGLERGAKADNSGHGHARRPGFSSLLDRERSLKPRGVAQVE